VALANPSPRPVTSVLSIAALGSNRPVRDQECLRTPNIILRLAALAWPAN